MPKPNVTALIIASALFMENVDSTVIATALPTIAADIDSDPIRLKLALTAYLLSLAVFIPVSGWAADRYGARLVFRLALAVFVIGSILCSAAGSLGEFVAARIVQGAGGAMMTPVGRLVLLRTTEKSKLLDAMAWFTVPALVGPLVGPPLGGFIATYSDWRWIFWINVPVGLVAILLVGRFIPDIRGDASRRLDRIGFVLSGVGLSGLVFGLSVLGQNMMPPAASAAMIAVGALATLAYLRHARDRAEPLLDLTLLKLRTFFVSAVGGSFFRLGIGAIPFLLPLMLQLGLGMSAFQSGLLTLFTAAGALTMKVSAQPILRRFGFRTTLLVNGVFSAVMLGAMATFVTEPPAIVMAGLLLLGGFFRSLQFTSLNTIAYAEVSQPRMGFATSLQAVSQQVSLAGGVALAAGIVELQRTLRGGDAILAGDFALAFASVAAVSLVSVAFYWRLPADAGAELANRRAAEPPRPRQA